MNTLPLEIINKIYEFMDFTDLVVLQLTDKYVDRLLLKKFNRKQHTVTNFLDENNLQAIRWMHLNNKKGFNIFTMDIAALYGHLDIIKFLHENRTEGCTLYAKYFAEENGHHEVYRWLVDNIKK